jgi:hypothetical protein
VDDTSITFTTTPSTFHAVAAQADNGIAVSMDLTTVTTSLYLDADFENSSSTDSVNTIAFADGSGTGTVLTTKTIMTLESTTGSLIPAGKLTLVAGSGLVILEDMTSGTANKALVFNSDFDSHNDGTLTVQTAKVITSNKSDVTITAWDVDLDGTLNAGERAISIHGAKTSQTIGIGASLSQQMEITDPELGSMTAEAGLTIGSPTTGEIQLNGVTDGNSDAVGTIMLVATKASTLVVFKTGASLFEKGIVVDAAGGVMLSESVSTQTSATFISAGAGTLTINADDWVSVLVTEVA